jgi:hypothetical protein
MQTQTYRRIDLEITDANGPRSISGMIDVATRQLDDHTRTVLCMDGSGNEAIVLLDADGVTRVYETRRGGVQDDAAIADAIREGVDPFLLCEPCEEVPLVVGAVYRDDELDLYGWTKGDGTSTEGYDWSCYFERDGRYLGPDVHGIEPQVSRASDRPDRSRWGTGGDES